MLIVDASASAGNETNRSVFSRSAILARIRAVHSDVPAPIRDLLATLDLYAELSATYRRHLVDAEHSGVGRYALVLYLHWDDGLDSEQFVMGPLCSTCVELVAERVADWTGAYPLATAEPRPWADVAVLRRGVWVPR